MLGKQCGSNLKSEEWGCSVTYQKCTAFNSHSRALANVLESTVIQHHTTHTTSARHTGVGVGRAVVLTWYFPWFGNRWSIAWCGCWFTHAYCTFRKGRHQGFPDAPGGSGLLGSRTGSSGSNTLQAYEPAAVHNHLLYRTPRLQVYYLLLIVLLDGDEIESEKYTKW